MLALSIQLDSNLILMFIRVNVILLHILRHFKNENLNNIRNDKSITQLETTR